MHSASNATKSRVAQYVFFDSDQHDGDDMLKSASLSTIAGDHRPCHTYVRGASTEGYQDDSWRTKQGKRIRPWSTPVARLGDLEGRLESDGTFPSCEEEDDNYGNFQDVMKVVVHEVLSDDFGLFTWPSAVVLAWMVWRRRREFGGARVVEIGTGTALPGLLVAKLGATVAFTDREGAPWVLDNVRGAIHANGLPLGGPHVGGSEAPREESRASPSPVEYIVSEPTNVWASFARRAPTIPRRSCGTTPGGIGATRIIGKRRNSSVGIVARGTCTKGDQGEEHPLELSGNTSGSHDAIGDRKRIDLDTGDGQNATRRNEGRCVVQTLPWGHITPAAIELAARHRPQFILGADVFYDSADFNAVLATVHLLLAGSVTPPRVSKPREPSVVASASSGLASKTPPMPAASSERTPIDVDCEATAESESTCSCSYSSNPKPCSCQPSYAPGNQGPGSGSFRSDIDVDTVWKPMFLTAYQERSARRTIRPLLRKWGLSARVLADGPEQVLPRQLWESGRYDSVALIEITLSDPQ